MPFERTAVTAGDHIDWMTTSPDAIRLTLSLKSFQNARNWPAFLASVMTFMVRSSSALVWLPLSPYLCSPMASTTMAASMIPIDGTLRIDALPLNCGLRSSFQLSFWFNDTSTTEIYTLSLHDALLNSDHVVHHAAAAQLHRQDP